MTAASWPKGKWLSDGGFVPDRGEELRALRFQTAAAFCASYEPLAYVVEPIIRTGSMYTLTAKTGGGKTGLAIVVCLAVATGRSDLLGMEVEEGRVAYLAFENPDDVRMRLMVAAYLLNVDLKDMGGWFVILDVRAKPEDLVANIARITQESGVFTLIVIDTFAAAFDGDDVNNNVQAGEFVRRLRPLSQLPGMPAVLIPAHPTKNATEDNIVPYGGGAILNEVDGNLTLVKRSETGNTVLHWQGKFRGLEFDAVNFRFEIVSCPDVVDTKGREVQLPVMRPCSADDVEDRVEQSIDIDRAILASLSKHPPPSLREIGEQIGRKKSSVEQRLNRLKSEKLAEKVLGKWRLTTKGSAAIEEKRDAA